MVTSKQWEAGQSYAAIGTGSGAIFGGNRAKSCAAVCKGRQNEWRVASGTHAFMQAGSSCSWPAYVG